MSKGLATIVFYLSFIVASVYGYGHNIYNIFSRQTPQQLRRSLLFK